MKTELSKKFPPKTVLFWIMNILIFLIINSATIAFITLLFIDNKTMYGENCVKNNSYFWGDHFVLDINGNKILDQFKQPIETPNFQSEIQATTFLFMVIGFLLSYFYIKFLYKIVIRKLDIKKENLSQDKELEIKKEALKMEKEKQELDILKIKAEAGLLTEKEIKRLEDRLC